MPRVPVYNSPQVAPNTVPQVRLAAPAYTAPTARGFDAPAAFVDTAGAQAQQTGQALQVLGRGIANLQNQANQLRVDDALNKVKEAQLSLTYDKDNGYTALKGVNALSRPDGKPLAQEYGDKLQKVIDGVSADLGNDAQRAMFARYSNDMLTVFRGGAMQHEAQEYKTYALSTSEGIQSTAMRDIGLNWNNPDAITSAVDRIKAETFRQAQLLGKSAEWQEAQARKLTSTAHRTALLSALEQNNPTYANAYLQKYSGQMDADDILAVRGHITKDVNAQVGNSVATEYIQTNPTLAGEGNRAFTIAVNTESGGRQFAADGTPLTSAKGAIGAAQVMPTTAPEAAKLAGLPWDENRYRNDEAYNLALGKAYFQKQLQDNGGDLAKAYAAYNAGPGALLTAVKGAKDGNWLALLPQETQDYVTKNMAAFNAGKGQTARPTFADIDAKLRADPRLADPERYKVARIEAERQYNQQTAAIQQRDDEAYKNALDALIQNGGKFADLSANIRQAIPPEKYTSILNDAARIAGGQHMVNDSMTWAEISSMTPAQLAAMTPVEFHNRYRTHLDDAHLERGYSMVLAARGDMTDPKHLEVLTTSERVKQAAQRVGILPYTGKPSDDQAKQFDQFQGIIDQRVRMFETTQLQGKRKASTDELQKVIDDTLMDTASVGRWYWTDKTNQPVALMSGDDLKNAYVKVGNEEIALTSVPAEQRGIIVGKLQKRGLPVTEQAIAELWVKAGKPK